jgi:DNA-binding transcriptional ArsR family regulator
MKAPFEELAALDRLVHEPARLSLLTALASCESADFLHLQRLTGLSKGNLSSHLSKLEGAGLLVVTKQFKGKTPHTQLAISAQGRQAIEQHWEQLDRLRSSTRRWAPGSVE